MKSHHEGHEEHEGLLARPAEESAGQVGGDKEYSVKGLADMLGVTGQSVWRWIHSGVRAVNGKRVYLEAQRIGGRWRISAEAWESFNRAINRRPAESGTMDDRLRRRSGRSVLAERRAARARETLRAAGF